jgi:hypothetical protein
MWKRKRNEIYSNKMKKPAQIFSTTIGTIVPTVVSSHRISNFLPSIHKRRTATLNTYYEEMKLLFIILRMFGHMPYHVTSKGKLCCPVKLIRFDKSTWIIFSSYLCAVLFSPLKEVPSMENVWISLQSTPLQALTFCSYKGFKLVDTLNCWPERHSIIGRKKEASSMETYFHILSKGIFIFT